MKITAITSQHRNDFAAQMECEHCGAVGEIKNGYDDEHYHKRVIPAMTCSSCGRNRAGETVHSDAGVSPVTVRTTPTGSAPPASIFDALESAYVMLKEGNPDQAEKAILAYMLANPRPAEQAQATEAMRAYLSSAADDPEAQRVFRIRHRPLGEFEVRVLEELKARAYFLWCHLKAHVPAGREQALALTKLEECVMWAVKAATA